MASSSFKNPEQKITPEMWEGFFRFFHAPLFVEDVTEVLKVLKKIKDQGVEDFEAWLDAHPEFISQTLPMFRVLDVSDFTVGWAGAKSKKELLKSLERMILPETLPALKLILVDLFYGRSHFLSESQYMTLDGRHLYTLNMAMLPSLEDDPALLFLATTEITDLKLAQLDLFKSQERYSRLVEAAQDVILSHSLSGEITFINQAGLDMTGWNKSSIVGQDLSFLLPDRQPDESRRTNLAVLSQTQGRSLYQTQMVTHDQKSIPVEVNATILPGTSHQDGEPLVLAMIRDITDRKEAEKKQRDLEIQLKETQKLESLGVLAGGIAHDFNNLLVTIMGNTELLLGGKYSKSEIQNSLEVIMEASTQAADLCRQMQAYSGHTKAQMNAENLQDILDNMTRLLQVSVSGRAHITFQTEDNLPLVRVDAGQIRQVIMNLVTNAAESLKGDGGEIVVRVGQHHFDEKKLSGGQHASLLYPGNYVFCEVRDSGSGMSPETVQRLFDPFFTTKSGNRGLGMSSALGIVQSHQGGFLVESLPGKGTTMTFLLPAIQTKGKRTKVEKPSKKSPDDIHKILEGKTVLSVDEDAAVRSVGEGFLRRLGCRVLSASNGPDAVRIYSDRHQDIDAVLLDLSMEGMDGVETCRRMRVINPDLPVVFASGFSVEEVQSRTGDLQHFHFVPKPFRLAQIRSIMGEVLGPGKK